MIALFSDPVLKRDRRRGSKGTPLAPFLRQFFGAYQRIGINNHIYHYHLSEIKKPDKPYIRPKLRSRYAPSHGSSSTAKTFARKVFSAQDDSEGRDDVKDLGAASLRMTARVCKHKIYSISINLRVSCIFIFIIIVFRHTEMSCLRCETAHLSLSKK